MAGTSLPGGEKSFLTSGEVPPLNAESSTTHANDLYQKDISYMKG